MNWQFTIQVGDKDNFVAPIEKNRKQIYIELEKSNGNSNVRFHTDTLIGDCKISNNKLAKDLLNIAIAIYCADKMILREEAYDGWTRFITLYIPVSDTKIWEGQKDLLLDAIRFLSGDYWEIVFRDLEIGDTDVEVQKGLYKNSVINKYELFSGGLDSFIGAIDLLESSTDNVCFISHYSSPIEKSIQKEVIDFLKNIYKGRINAVQINIQPPNSQELSQRSRSILFIALGFNYALSQGKRNQLYICENGFISLNVPLSPNRIGSNSTRTTHPFFIDRMRKLVCNIGNDVEILTNYQFKTKGEMIKDTQNKEVLAAGVGLTRSCSKSNLRYAGYSPKGHCGVCLPCIVRRSALRAAGYPEGNYLHDISQKSELSESEGNTLRAMELSLQYYKNKRGTLIFDVLANGQIPSSSGLISDYESVFRRGLVEIGKLIQ